MLVKLIRFILALTFLFLMLYLGRLMSWLIPIGISESIWGLLILFTLLVTKLVRVAWIAPASRPLLRYMTVFFLPVCAGIVDQTDVLKLHINSLLVANFISTVVSLVIIGLLAEWLFRKVEAEDD
uniref:CidA/LrgA family protein n=2 Tax=Glaesserella sp. TaxID=2094731 RepID=UPI0035A1D328